MSSRTSLTGRNKQTNKEEQELNLDCALIAAVTFAQKGQQILRMGMAAIGKKRKGRTERQQGFKKGQSQGI